MDGYPESGVDTLKAEIDPVEAYGILRHLPLGVVICELNAKRRHPLLLTNEMAAELLGLPSRAGEATASLEDAAVLEFGEPLLGGIAEASRRGGPLTRDWVLDSGAGTRHISCGFVPLRRNAGAEAPRVLCTLADRTAERQAESQLLHNALHDGLTGLPNRNLFLNRLQDYAAVPASGEAERQCGIVIVNVDRFQLINESFGHQAADEFLRGLARDLAALLRAGDLLARFNGDEFAVLMPDISGTNDAGSLARRIHAVMENPRMIADTLTTASVSIGIATTLTSSRHPEDLIRDADVAMHRAKGHGRASTELFTRGSNRQVAGQIRLEAALRDAIESDELELFYQPIVDLKTGDRIAFEALARWRHPEQGLIPPGKFIPIAEDSGLIMPLGRWALETATAQLAAWRSFLPHESSLQMAINLSPVQILGEDVAGVVAACLETSGIPPAMLRLEITEGALIADPSRAADVLRKIKDLGVSLALDDFGTGYSSLSYLHRYPIDCIKIDRAFTGRIDREDSAVKIVRSIMMLAEALEMGVIAEGIETPEQKKRMLELNCRLGQGFLFAKPLPRAEAEEFLDLPRNSGPRRAHA